jgi:hypothetical protein
MNVFGEAVETASKRGVIDIITDPHTHTGNE